MNDELLENKLSPSVYGRSKSHSSIYGKMVLREKSFEEIHDILAIRVVVKKIEECYLALGILHQKFKPIQERIKDFIAMPKSNGYQSIHTTIVGPEGKIIEIQIRTEEMEKTAEIGVAAHWRYKEGRNSSANIDSHVEWLRDLLEMLQSEENDPKEFMHLLKIDLFGDEIFVFTPNGDLLQLPANATPVDFAYEVHTDIGNSLIGCKINRKYAPLNVQLESGQTVEIETDKKGIVDPGWLNFVVTSKARTAIRAQLRLQKTSSARKAGKLLLESELKRSGKALKEYRGSILKNILQRTGVRSLNQLLTDIGLGKKTSTIVAERFYDGLQIRKDKKKIIKSFELKNNKIDGLSVTYGKCCMPIEGDSIVAHSDTERGIVIHHSRCNEVAPYKQDKERYLSLIHI